MADNYEETSSSVAHQAMEDHVLDKPQKGKGKGKGGGGGGGGRRGGNRETQVSKALSRLLRHQAENAGIKLDGEGFAPLDRVLAWPPIRSLNVTFAEVQEAVSSNEKQRFSMKPSRELSTESTDPRDYLIRANQGHSIKLDSSALLVPVTAEDGTVPPRVVHGTYFVFWPRIVESGGLRAMGRNHVHCSTGTPEEGVVSGMRHDAELVVELDVEASLRDGIKWWKSDNGVVLTEGDGNGLLSCKYFKMVTGRKVDVGVLWQDGEKVADLPAGIKGRVPMGKERQSGGRRGGGSKRGAS